MITRWCSPSYKWILIPLTIPRCSMYGIFAYIWAIFGVNVGKYSIHGAYGIGISPTKTIVKSDCETNLSRFRTGAPPCNHCVLGLDFWGIKRGHGTRLPFVISRFFSLGEHSTRVFSSKPSLIFWQPSRIGSFWLQKSSKCSQGMRISSETWGFWQTGLGIVAHQ